ncbi:hypothetical protein B7R87_29605 [Streptomyces tsukubensis]|nr:hypothetical protein B7R87_29605 [Streptomyces tsukubensis]EIF93759.1 hypothetical protein [Streptomyces tsukubensis NRRL18488]
MQGFVEAHMEIMLGVWFLANEYSTGAVHGGRIDSLDLDENGAPVIVECERATDARVIHQGLTCADDVGLGNARLQWAGGAP